VLRNKQELADDWWAALGQLDAAGRQTGGEALYWAVI